jgi:hypothetical protein
MSSAIRGEVAEFNSGEALALPDEATQLLSVPDPGRNRLVQLSVFPARLYIFDMSTAVIDRTVGDYRAIVPFEHAVYGVADSGQVVELESGVAVGAIPGGQPTLPTVAVLGCAALAFNRDGVFQINCDGSVERVAESDGLQGVRAGADGVHFVLAYGERILLLQPGGMSATIEAAWIPAADHITDADISSDGAVVLVSALGGLWRLPAVSSSAPVRADKALPAGVNRAAFLDNGGIITLSADGVLTRFGASMEVLAASQPSKVTDRLDVVDDRIYTGSFTGGIRIVDSASMLTIETLSKGFLLPPGRRNEDEPLHAVYFDNASDGAVQGHLLSIPQID